MTQKKSLRKKVKDRKIGNSQHLNMAIGHFYNHLAQRLLGGKIKPFSYEYGDIENFDLGLMIEVKGFNNNHTFQVYICQLQRFLDNLFPFDHCLILFFNYINCYRYRASEKRISKVAKTENGVYKTLGLQTTELYIVDTEIIMAIAKFFEKKLEWRRDGKSVEIIKLTKKLLRQLVRSPAKEFGSYDLSEKKFSSGNFKIKLVFWKSRMAFDCFFILPRKIVKNVLQRINRSRGLIGLAEIATNLTAA